jgi:phage tail-like protein
MANSFSSGPNNNTQEGLDKLGENHFTLKVDGLSIGHFREVTGLQMEREILEYAEGGNNDFIHKLPGRAKYPNLVLKRGTTNEKALAEWFWSNRESPVLKRVTLSLLDSALDVKRTWIFEAAYPVKWIGPNLNAGSDSPATEQLELAHRGMGAP